MIGYGMIYAVAVGLPVFVAAAMVSALLRRHGRPERGVWIAGLVVASALPPFMLTRSAEAPVIPPTTPMLAPIEAVGPVGLPNVVALPEVSLVTPEGEVAPYDLDGLLIALWLLASSLLAARWGIAARRLHQMTRLSPRDRIDDLDVTLTVDLGPAVAGWLRPQILIPAWIVSLPTRQRSLVLLHEHEHLRARDPYLIVLSRIVRVLVPWNPFAWLLTARLLRAVELDCDRRVLRRRPDVEAYGQTLLTVSSRDPGALVGAAAFAETEAPLRRRILAMTTPQSTVSIVGLVTVLVLGILLTLGALGIPVPRVAPVAPAPIVAGAEADPRVEEIERTIQELELLLAAQADALAEQADALAEQAEATERVARLREELSAAEAARLEATTRAEVAERLLTRFADGRSEVSPASGERSPVSGQAQEVPTGTITGVARDGGTGEPLPNVQVHIPDIGIGALSNNQGRYLLLHVPAGQHDMVAARTGFTEVAQSVEVTAGGTVDASVDLRQTAIQTNPLLVFGEQTDGGVAPLIYIDNVRVSGPEPRDLDELIDPREVDRIEIIKPGAAVELYGEEASAGVVHIFRKLNTRPDGDVVTPTRASGAPTFTPFTVAPQILNVDEVRAAMAEAYTDDLRADNIGGTVTVYFFIDEDGNVQDYRINESSGHHALDDAALQVAGVYRFSPALNRDEKVAVWVYFPIAFVPAG